MQNKGKLIEVLGKKYSNVIKTNINILPVKFYSPNNTSNENDNNDNEIDSKIYSYKNKKKNFKKKIKKKK